jgi:hypothetical protein
MIRPFTCVAFLLACGSGLYLYQSKHRVKVLDEQIAQVAHATDALREQTRMLSAEWTLLNDPERLRQLATQFLSLQTVSPNQFTSLADLDSRLPPVPPPAPAAPPPADTAPSDQVPVASDNVNGNATDEGKPADTASADAKPAAAKIAEAPKPAAPAHVAAATPPEPSHAAEHKLTVAHAAPMPPRAVAEQSQPAPQLEPWEWEPERRPEEHPEGRNVQQHSVPQRNVQPRLADARPVSAVVRAPARLPAAAPVMPRASGSMLGMAPGMGAPPAPTPLPRPTPVGAPAWSFSNGG